MKHIALLLAPILLAQAEPIDRHALVARHNIEWNDIAGTIPLGNGEFCFNADGTGLQTFGGNTMAHWAWHSFPPPEGWTPDKIPPTGTFQQGRNTGPDVFPADKAALRTWLFDNPHILNLGRLRLCDGDGAPLKRDQVAGLARTLDLWSGIQTSTFTVDGQTVRVETCVTPKPDAVAVRIVSPLVASGRLGVTLDFPYPSLKSEAWVGDFSHPQGHLSLLQWLTESGATFDRRIDDTRYHVRLDWSEQAALSVVTNAAHRFLLRGGRADTLTFTCTFAAQPVTGKVPMIGNPFAESSNHWKNFWSTGGAVDLAQSRDPRWRELERRIVLSQYLLAAQSAGSWPSAEAGLMTIDPWRGQFHMEMVWWHLAHYGLWDRWAMADEAVGCYARFLPAARALAEQLGYAGAKWPKSVGPEGRSAPWVGNQVLLWKQPHPLFFAELEYRLKPTRATLEKWAPILEATAAHMADYPTRDPATGLYSLVPSMPPSEQGITRDTVFDLAYWRWGLDQAQRWRERLGLPREARWDEIRSHLAPLPTVDGVFVHSAEWTNTYTKRAWEHPDPVGVLGMLPPIEGVDREIAHRTVRKVWDTWNWNKCWGWDFPWMAMAAARVGEPQIAVDALLKESPRNAYDRRGVNTGGPCPYLPGNGGLLYAVAMMAAGWDGAPMDHAPGFPKDGSWTVRWEGLRSAP